eukprot:EG_transcript_934
MIDRISCGSTSPVDVPRVNTSTQSTSSGCSDRSSSRPAKPRKVPDGAIFIHSITPGRKGRPHAKWGRRDTAGATAAGESSAARRPSPADDSIRQWAAETATHLREFADTMKRDSSESFEDSTLVSDLQHMEFSVFSGSSPSPSRLMRRFTPSPTAGGGRPPLPRRSITSTPIVFEDRPAIPLQSPQVEAFWRDQAMQIASTFAVRAQQISEESRLHRTPMDPTLQHKPYGKVEASEASKRRVIMDLERTARGVIHEEIADALQSFIDRAHLRVREAQSHGANLEMQEASTIALELAQHIQRRQELEKLNDAIEEWKQQLAPPSTSLPSSPVTTHQRSPLAEEDLAARPAKPLLDGSSHSAHSAHSTQLNSLSTTQVTRSSMLGAETGLSDQLRRSSLLTAEAGLLEAPRRPSLLAEAIMNDSARRSPLLMAEVGLADQPRRGSLLAEMGLTDSARRSPLLAPDSGLADHSRRSSLLGPEPGLAEQQRRGSLLAMEAGEQRYTSRRTSTVSMGPHLEVSVVTSVTLPSMEHPLLSVQEEEITTRHQLLFDEELDFQTMLQACLAGVGHAGRSTETVGYTVHTVAKLHETHGPSPSAQLPPSPLCTSHLQSAVEAGWETPAPSPMVAVYPESPGLGAGQTQVQSGTRTHSASETLTTTGLSAEFGTEVGSLAATPVRPPRTPATPTSGPEAGGSATGNSVYGTPNSPFASPDSVMDRRDSAEARRRAMPEVPLYSGYTGHAMSMDDECTTTERRSVTTVMKEFVVVKVDGQEHHREEVRPTATYTHTTEQRLVGRRHSDAEAWTADGGADRDWLAQCSLALARLERDENYARYRLVEEQEEERHAVSLQSASHLTALTQQWRVHVRAAVQQCQTDETLQRSRLQHAQRAAWVSIMDLHHQEYVAVSQASFSAFGASLLLHSAATTTTFPTERRGSGGRPPAPPPPALALRRQEVQREEAATRAHLEGAQAECFRAMVYAQWAAHKTLSTATHHGAAHSSSSSKFTSRLMVFERGAAGRAMTDLEGEEEYTRLRVYREEAGDWAKLTFDWTATCSALPTPEPYHSLEERIIATDRFESTVVAPRDPREVSGVRTYRVTSLTSPRLSDTFRASHSPSPTPPPLPLANHTVPARRSAGAEAARRSPSPASIPPLPPEAARRSSPSPTLARPTPSPTLRQRIPSSRLAPANPPVTPARKSSAAAAQ